MGTQRKEQDRKDADEADDRNNWKLHFFAAEYKRYVERNFELAGAEGIVHAQRYQGQENERITGCRSERVEIGQEIEPTFAAEEMRVEKGNLGKESGRSGKEQLDDRDNREEDDGDYRRPELPIHALKHGRQQAAAAHRIRDARTAENAGVGRDQEQHGAEHRRVERCNSAVIRDLGGK